MNFSISSTEFAQEVETFLAGIPAEGDVKGLAPTLLLFRNEQTATFVWYYLDSGRMTVLQAVEHFMRPSSDSERLRDYLEELLMPLGVIRLYIKRRPNNTYDFSEAEWWIHPLFRAVEINILNGTVPYFLNFLLPDVYKLTPDRRPAEGSIRFERVKTPAAPQKLTVPGDGNQRLACIRWINENVVRKEPIPWSKVK